MGHWGQRMTEGHEHVDIRNFGRSWNDGMAFCALFHHFIPDQIPYETLDPRNREFNFHLAFTEGEKAGVAALLDVEDMVEMLNPDWRSVMTYISLIYNHFNGIRVGGPRLPPMFRGAITCLLVVFRLTLLRTKLPMCSSTS